MHSYVVLIVLGLLFCDKEESIKVKSNAVNSSADNNTSSRYTSPQKAKFNSRSPDPSSPLRKQPITRKSIPHVEIPISQTVTQLDHTNPEQMTFVNGMCEVDDDIPIIERRKRTVNRNEESPFNGKKKQLVDEAEEQVTVAAVSNRKLKTIAVKSHSSPSDFFESEPITPQNDHLESNLDSEQQYDTADNDSNSQVYLNFLFIFILKPQFYFHRSLSRTKLKCIFHKMKL
jgi:hypothetical protein